MPAFNRAIKHKAAGLGWMYVDPRQETSMYAGAPKMEQLDPKQSGQNPEFTEYCWDRVKGFVAGDEFYLRQVEQRLAELDKDLARSAAAVNAAIEATARAQAERDRVAALLPADSETSVMPEQAV
jgi:hypothetical protein